MIITCPCGDKKFNVDASLIPQEGRTLQCGFCDRKWFFKKENTDDEIKILEKKIPEPVIQDNKNITNTSNNTTEQTPDLSISGTDSTARALTAMGYGIP